MDSVTFYVLSWEDRHGTPQALAFETRREAGAWCRENVTSRDDINYICGEPVNPPHVYAETVPLTLESVMNLFNDASER